MSQIWSWIAEIALALLLMGTLVMTLRLDRALRMVRRDRASIEALISNLGAATNAVKFGIQELRNEADRATGQIERRSEEADKMATDLSFLIEAADRAGAKLEERLLAVPKPPVVESRAVTTARRLMIGGQFARRRQSAPPATNTISTAAVTPAPGIPAHSGAQPDDRPVKLTFPDLLVAETSMFQLPPLATPLGLRELAGITTRRRDTSAGRSQVVEKSLQPEAELDPSSVILAETDEEPVRVKMVG